MGNRRPDGLLCGKEYNTPQGGILRYLLKRKHSMSQLVILLLFDETFIRLDCTTKTESFRVVDSVKYYIEKMKLRTEESMAKKIFATFLSRIRFHQRNLWCKYSWSYSRRNGESTLLPLELALRSDRRVRNAVYSYLYSAKTVLSEYCKCKA